MITINTINHSWYFIKETIIKPNTSLTYDETLLNKSETKDLLESVSSKRVNLSSEDLMKVQNRYNSFNSGGNVDLSGILSKIEEIYKDGGASGATLTNVEYNNGVFNYTSGNIGDYPGYTAIESISVVQSGTLTVSSIPTGVTYIAVISGNQVPNDFPSVLLILGDGTLATTQTTYPVSYGDTIEIQWTANSISALIGGQWVSSTIGNALNDPHLLVFSVANTAPLYFSIPGFVPGGARSGVLVEEIDERIQADLDITADISTVRTLAETNQLNISTKTDQTDFDSLAEIVTDNGLLLAQKASQFDLDTLATEVSTKATPADISAAIAALVDGAPAALDTLYEIVGELSGNAASINDLLIQINGKVGFDDAQSLTTTQQLQARQNINAEAVGVAATLIAAITAASIGAATAAQGAKADSALQSGDVAPVALSGSYTALTDKPTLFGLSSLLTGLGAGTNTAISATDSLIAALAKLQAQIASASSPSGVLTQPKFNGSRYPANLWYDCFYPFQYPLVSSYFSSYQQYLIRFTALEDATFTKLGFWCPTASMGVNDGGYYLGVYSSDSNGNPSTALYRSAALTNVNTTGAKTTTLSISLTKGQTVWLSVLLYAYSGSLYFTGFRLDNTLLPAISGASALNTASAIAYISTQANVSNLPATIDMGTFSQISLSLYLPRLMLGT